MTKVYQEIPSNFEQILPYVIHEDDASVNAFFSDINFIFYDTCSFLHHSQSINSDIVLDYLKSKTTVVVITRTVLMELGSNGGSIHHSQVEYFEKLHSRGFKIIIIDEEKTIELIKYMLEITTKDANQLLGYAVKQVSKSRGAVNDLVNEMDSLQKAKLLGNQTGNTLLYKDFFEYARSKKVSGDSLAEELILICVILLAKLNRGVAFLVSDDLQIRSQIIDAQSYTEKFYDNKSPIQLTTCRIISDIFIADNTVSKDKISEILDCCFTTKVTVVFTTMYSLQMEMKTFSCSELVAEIFNTEEFKVYY